MKKAIAPTTREKKMIVFFFLFSVVSSTKPRVIIANMRAVR